MTRDKKDTAMVVSALAMLVFAALLTTVGFILDPQGEIHDSVLWVLGQAFLYAGGIFGVSSAVRIASRREFDRRFREYDQEHEQPTIEEEEEEDEKNN